MDRWGEGDETEVGGDGERPTREGEDRVPIDGFPVVLR